MRQKSHLTPWGRAIVAAWLRRSIPPAWHREEYNGPDGRISRHAGFEPAPDYHPARACAIYRRWPIIIGAALDGLVDVEAPPPESGPGSGPRLGEPPAPSTIEGLGLSINGKAVEDWPPAIRAEWDERVRWRFSAPDTCSAANYTPPRPYRNEYDRGCEYYQFTYTVQPGNRVCFVRWR